MCVAAIAVLIKLFQTKGRLHGLLGIIFLIYPFLWGWRHAKDQKLVVPMLIWTIGAFCCGYLSRVYSCEF